MEFEEYCENNLSDDDRTELLEAANKIKDGKVILFLGAGIHCPPPKGFEHLYDDALRPPSGKELAKHIQGFYPGTIGKAPDLKWVDEYVKDNKTAGELKERILKQLEEKQVYPLSWIAQYDEVRQRQRSLLIDKVAAKLKNTRPSPIVRALAEMPFRYIITTNYDTLYEQAIEEWTLTQNAEVMGTKSKVIKKGIYKPNKKGRPPEPTTDYNDSEITAESPFIYKIHGDIDDVYPDGNYDPKRDAIVLTDEDYIHFILRMGDKDNLTGKSYNPIPSAFTKALSESKNTTVLFIGYSLMDYNLRLLFKSTMWGKDIETQFKKWSVDLYPDYTVKSIFDREYTLVFIKQDAWSAIAFLYKEIFGTQMPFV